MEKVARLPNGRKLLGLMESVQDRKSVDEIVESEGVTEIRDPNLQHMRETIKGRMGSHMMLEEEKKKKHRKEEVPVDDSGSSVDLSEAAVLAGIPQQ